MNDYEVRKEGDTWAAGWLMPSWNDDDEPIVKFEVLGEGYHTQMEAEAFIDGYRQGLEDNR